MQSLASSEVFFLTCPNLEPKISTPTFITKTIVPSSNNQLLHQVWSKSNRLNPASACILRHPVYCNNRETEIAMKGAFSELPPLRSIVQCTVPSGAVDGYIGNRTSSRSISLLISKIFFRINASSFWSFLVQSATAVVDFKTPQAASDVSSTCNGSWGTRQLV